MDQVRNDLPPEAQVPVINIENADSTIAAAYLSFSSKFLRQNEITDYLVRIVQPRLTAVEGVQKADILGARTFAMRIWLKPDRMAALNVSPAQVRQALAANNYLAAVGTTKGALVQVNLRPTPTSARWRSSRGSSSVRAAGRWSACPMWPSVVLGAEDYDTAVAFTGETAVFIGIWALPNANSLDVIKKIRVELAAIQKELPAQITATMAYDATEYIQSAIDDVVSTLRDTLFIVVVVIFLFLGSFRSVLVPVVAIPVSLIGAVFLMQTFGFTLNLLTLLAIVLSVGLVVDDAIVVVENVERHLSEGKTPLQASLVGARELVGPIIAMTITLAAVYVPVAFQGGLTGSLFREFALTLAGAVTISGVVALTLSPVMSRYLLHAGGEREGFAGDHQPRLRTNPADLQPLARGGAHQQGDRLHRLGRAHPAHRPDVPDGGEGACSKRGPGLPLRHHPHPRQLDADQVEVSTKAVHDTVIEVPESKFTFQLTNPGGGFWGVGPKPWDQRKRTTAKVLPEIQRRISAIPGIEAFAAASGASGGGMFPVEFVIASTAEEGQILEFAKQLQERRRRAASSGSLRRSTEDRPAANRARHRPGEGRPAEPQSPAGRPGPGRGCRRKLRQPVQHLGRSHKVIPQLLRAERLNPEQLQDVYVTGANGWLVKLSSIASVKDTVVPRSLNRFQQLNAVKISGVAQSVDEGIKFLEGEAAKILPQGYKIDYTGESRQLRVRGNKFLPAFALAVVLIFLVLAAQFNSFRDPFIILLGSVPLALFGAMIPSFLKMPNAQILLHRLLQHHLQHLLAGGSGDAGGALRPRTESSSSSSPTSSRSRERRRSRRSRKHL